MTKKITFTTSKILKKVTTLFHTKGYCATSMQDIVAVSQLNRSSLYNTFGSKLELFINCFDASEKNYRREIQKIILSVENPLKAIRNILELSIKESINENLIPNYIAEIRNDEILIIKLMESQKSYLLGLFEDLIKKGQNSGAINNGKSNKQYAYFLVVSYYGLQNMKSLSNNENKLENVIYNIISVLER